MRVRNPLQIFLSVEKALFLRELNTRISVGRTGLFWTFIEPFFQIFLFILIRIAIMSSSGSTGGGFNYDFVVFMASGFIAFNMYKSTLSNSNGAFAANKALFSYKQVKPIDTIIGRLLLELFLTSIIILIFLSLGFFFNYEIVPENLPMVVLGYLWFLLFSFSIGLLVAVGNAFFMSIGKFVNMINMPLLFISAIFFPVESVSPVVQEVLLYNPIVHFMEMIHGYYIYELDDRFVNYRYMLLWTIIPLFMAMWLYKKLEKRIISE